MRKRKASNITRLTALLASISAVQAINLNTPTNLTAPSLDFNKLGDVYLAGQFDGISPITYEGQQRMLAEPQSSHDSLVVQYSPDVFTTQSFADGLVSSSCLLDDNVTAVIAGNFTKVFNTSISKGFAAVNLLNETVVDIGDSIDGSEVKTLYCNGSQVYIGGSFNFKQSSSAAAAAAVWYSNNNSVQLPAFGGFVKGSVVNSIVPFGDNVVYGGNFSGLVSMETTNSTRNSSRLLKPGMQPVSFNLANATGFNSQSSDNGTNASSILCPLSQNDDGWSAALDVTTGYVNVTLAYMSQPTLIRLFNLADGSGTKTFRIISEPAGSFMNLTYTDGQGNLQSCAAECPLPEYNNSVRHTDFAFVNVVPTSSFRIQLLDFYGDHAGLKGLQLFEEGQFAFAYNAFNNPRQCGSTDSSNNSNEVIPTSSATSQLVGGNSWTLVSDFMATNITDKSTFSKVYARFNPTFDSYTISEGRYEVLLYTPGCKQYGTCSQRGQVNVTVYTGSGSPLSTILYQTNEDLKYDLIYNGTLQEGSYIRLTPGTQNSVPMDFVAYKVSLNYLGKPEKYNASKLFEYSKSNFTLGSTGNEPVGKTAINELGKNLGTQANVESLVVNGSTLLIGGSSFSANVSNSSNLLSLSKGSVAGIPGIGSDEGNVYLSSTNNTFIASTSKQVYLLSGQNVTSLGIGSVSGIVPFQYNNTQYNLLPSSVSNSIAVWNPRLKSLNSSGFFVSGRISSGSYFAVKNVTVYMGSIQLASTVSPDASVLSGSNGEPATPSFVLKDSVSKLNRRDTDSSVPSGTILGGIYLNSSDVLIYGHFNASGTNSSSEPIANALLDTDSGSTNFFGSNYNVPASDSTIYTAVAVNSSYVFVGGDFQGSVNGTQVQGAMLYSDRAVRQPVQLNANDVVKVLTAEAMPNTSDILVGGDFQSGSGVSNASCNGMCMFMANETKWVSPANLELDAGSVVNSLVFETGTRVVFGGNLSSSTGSGQVAVYEFANSSFQILPDLPGAVNKLVVVTNTTNNPVYVASGTSSSGAFVQWIDSSQNSWQSVPDLPFLDGTSVSTLSLITLSSSSGAVNSTTPFNSSQALLVSGQLQLASGPASVAVFDGSKWSVLYATTNGSVRSVFAQFGGSLNGGAAYAASSSQPRNRGHGDKDQPMAVGHVVGIACGIGICCVLVLMLFYVLCEFILNYLNDGTAYQNLSSTDSIEGTKIVK